MGRILQYRIRTSDTSFKMPAWLYKASAPTIVYIKFFIIWLLNLPIKSPFSKYITKLQSVPIVQNPTRPKTYMIHNGGASRGSGIQF